MKHYFLILTVILLISPLRVLAEKQEITDIDGTDWSEWQPFQKYSFISGFMAGSSYVINNNYQSQDEKYNSDKANKIYWSYLLPDEKKPKNNFSRKEVSSIIDYQSEEFNGELSRYAIIGITNGQLVEGLNTLYADFKNKQIKIKDALYAVRKQIKGASTEETEAILQYLRSDKDRKKLFYIDKDGKKKYVSFP